MSTVTHPLPTSASGVGARNLVHGPLARVQLPREPAVRCDPSGRHLAVVAGRRLVVARAAYGVEESGLPSDRASYRVELPVGGARPLVLTVPRASLESLLSDLLGRPVTEVVGFAPGLDVTTPVGRSLVGAVQLLGEELDRPGGLAALPAARAQLESYVMTALLQAGRHQFSDALAGREERRRLGRLAPVVAYIEDNADTELTPELLARVGCVSVRTLHAAFAEQLGESPMAYVRRTRLGKVRAELLAADPGGVRVTDVAMKWGFFHQSRFAQQYRDQFDELPSVTLAR